MLKDSFKSSLSYIKGGFSSCYITTFSKYKTCRAISSRTKKKQTQHAGTLFHIPYLFAVTMGSDCFANSYIKGRESITLQWKGADPGSLGCKYRFRGQNMLYRYKVCVETKEFFLQSRGISVAFSSGYSLSNSVVRKLTFQMNGWVGICYSTPTGYLLSISLNFSCKS